MAISVPSDQATPEPHAPATMAHDMTVGTALRIAWLSYLLLLFCPFFLFLYVSWALSHESARRISDTADYWFLGSMAYLAVVLPAAIFLRSWMFRSYWRGKPVPPHWYLAGMLTVWVALEVGGIVALVGCLMSRSLVPGLIPAAVAFMFFTPLWPSGRAMVKPVGNSDDPSTYEEPH